LNLCLLAAGDSIVCMPARQRNRPANWLAFCVGILLLAVLVAGSLELIHKPKRQIPGVTIGTKDQVYYSGATLQDATTLGHALQETGFFNDRGTSVLLSKNRGVTVVSFVLDNGTWNHASTAAAFEEIGRRVATSIGGFPIELHLVDPEWVVRRSLAVGKVTVGTSDSVYYLGTATEGDAKALGQALREAGYLADLGVSVVVSKGDGTALGFVIGEGVWDRPDTVAGFERLGRRVAASIGGRPIQVRLLNAQMETKKEIAVP